MKASVAYLLVFAGFLALVLFSNQPDRPKTKVHRNLHPGRRLIVRKLHPSPGSKHENVAFDPIVAQIERKREDRSWEKEYFEKVYKQWNDDSATTHDPAPHPESQPEPEDWDYSDQEAYLNDEDQFNVSSRIVTLFPLIDIHPPDGIINLDELHDWHYKAALREAEHRSFREMEMYDKNRDGMISLSEYLPHSTIDSANDSMEHGGVGWWKAQFDAADDDEDGLLNATEFNNFLHPQDSHSEKLHKWLRRQQVINHDRDKDGKISFLEFQEELYDLIKAYDDASDHTDSVGRRDKEMFGELDKDMDGFLSEDELAPITNLLYPGEAYFAKQQAEYLMSQADKNKDGHLTLEEMLETPYIFYSTAYAYDDYQEYYHDEF